jgi:hypothetical protein
LTRQAIAAALLAALTLGWLGSARADEIVFKEEFGGEKVKCEIYKEDKKYIHYIDVKKKMDCGCSKEIVAKIKREDKQLIDVEQFFLKKAKDAKDRKAREKAEKIAGELRKKREAAEAAAKKAGKPDTTGTRKIGKCLIKPTTEKTGIKILRSKDTGSSEILVDPFPDEDKKPKTEPPKSTKKPRKKRRKK